jgi:rhamnosyl/mannosyltransferase
LRICHLGKYYPPASGGIESHLQTLARGQAALGCRVEVVCVNHRDRTGRDVTWNAARTPTIVEADGAVRVTRLGRLASVAKLDLCPGLPRLLAGLRDSADVIHLHTPNPTMLLALAVRPPGPPLVITHHSDVVQQKFLGRLQRPFEHRVYSLARSILATSPAYAAGSSLLRHYDSRVDSLPLGIDLAPFREPNPPARAFSARLRADWGSPLWLCVGRLVYYKGLATALRALAELPGRLLIVGAGPLETELKRLAAERGVADRVVWRPRLTPDELTGAYHAATALWFPSNARSEGFGLVQVEALASGCPIVNTAIPHSGVAWVSPDGATGLTVPPDDAPAFAAAARRLLDDPDLRHRLGQGGRERAEAMFSVDRMARASLSVYQSCVAGPAQKSP